MPISNDNLNKKLYDLLKTQGFDPIPKNSKGETTPVPEEADVFRFTFKVDGKPVGPAWITVDSNQELKVYYDDEVMGGMNEADGEGHIDDFTEFLQQLKKWAQRRQLGFDLENQDHLESDMAQREHVRKQEQINEGYYPMGKSASYNDSIPSVKIILQHTRQIQEGEQRFRNIAKIFLENQIGERILAPTTRPGIAKVYARHLAEGGLPHDERWNHIGSLVEEYTKMAGFVRATRDGQFNESAQQLVNEGINHYQSLRETLSRMIGHRGYNAYFESWTPALMETEGEESSLNELFVQETLDPRIESVMPILSRLHKKVNEMSEVKALEEWADQVISEKMVMGSDSDASSAGSYKMGEATDLKSIPQEGMLHNPGHEDSPVVNAIIRRILLQRTDLLAKYGPEKVGQAVDSVADFVGDVDEIGSSDVSGWIKQVENELGGISEAPGAETLAHNEKTASSNLKAFDLEEGIADDYEDMADRELMRHARMLGLEKNIVPDGEGGLANRREVIRLLQAQAHDEDLEEGLDPEKKARLKDLIDAYSEATDPEYMGDVDYEDIIAQIRAEFGDRTADSVANGPSMHFPRPGHSMGYDDLEFRQMHKKMSPNRITKLGKLHKQDSDSMKRDIKSKLDVEEGLGDVAKKVGSALKTGAKAVGKAIVGKDDDELLRDLKKRAGVHNPQTGKPSMAQSDVEKVDEDLGPEQKKVGQLGPTEKVKNNNIGKLVGANESFINTVDQAVVSEMDKSEDKKGPEGKAKPITPKKMADDAKKVLDKKNVKEGQEDLEAILRIIRK